MNPTEAAIRQARELHRRGLDAGTAGREAEAMRLLRRALRALDAAPPAEPAGDVEWHRTRIRTQVSLAYSEAELGTFQAGLATLNSVRPQIAELADGPVVDELTGFVDHNHATLLMRVGRDEESLPLLDSAIEHKERSLARGTDDPERMTDSLVASLTNRGLAYVVVGRLGLATLDLNRATALSVEHDLPLGAAYANLNLGDLKRRAGEIPDALRFYDEAERIYREQGPEMLPRLRLDQAQALLAAGLADEAGRHLDEALPVLRQLRHYQNLAEAELFRAAAALLEEDWATARRMAKSARRRMIRRGSDGWATIAALLHLRVDAMQALSTGKVPASLSTRADQLAEELGALRLADESALARMLAVRLEVHRGRLDRAAELLHKVHRPRPVTPIEQRMLLRLCKAELAVAEGNRRKAFAQARAGLGDLSRARDRMGGLDLVSGTSLHGQELGDLAVRLVLDGGDSAAQARRLFDWLERTRAQAYRYEPVSGTQNPELVGLIAEVRSLGHALREARLNGEPTAKLQSRYAARQRVAVRMGWHASRWGKPRPVATFAEVGEQLGTRALISFAVSGDAMVAVTVVDGRIRVIRLGSATTAIESARRLHADLNAMAPDHLPMPLRDAITHSARKQADALDAQLMRPLDDVIGGRDTVIVPTGALYAVPWNVLGSLRSRPIVVAPSATAWLTASQSASAEQGPTVLVRGPGLPAAVGEIDKLAAHHRNAILLADKGANVSTVLNALDGAGLAHIAAHGEHEADNALFSKLELLDGALFAHEMAALRRPPRHVVLAACQLALNRIRPGDEALGFAGALLASGTATVVAAASRVGDQPAAAAMDDYHQALATGAVPAVALADACAVDPFRRPFICLGSS